jgi:hypothetical protein
MLIMPATQRDPESGSRFSEEIMLNQQNEVMARSFIGA